MNRVAIILFSRICFFGILIYVQIQLSKSRNKRLGLIFPFISILFSLAAGVGTVAFMVEPQTKQVVEIKEDGTMVEIEPLVDLPTQKKPVQGAVPTMIYIFVFYNIPTTVYLAIYFAQRQKIKNISQIEKMSIQDLE